MEEEIGPITLQILLFLLYNKHVTTTTLWKEEKKEMKKVIENQGEEIVDLKEQLAKQKKKMVLAPDLTALEITKKPDQCT